MTLDELKAWIKIQLAEMKETLKRLKHENCGIDPHSGIYSQTGKYQMKQDLEIAFIVYSDILERIKGPAKRNSLGKRNLKRRSSSSASSKSVRKNRSAR